MNWEEKDLGKIRERIQLEERLEMTSKGMQENYEKLEESQHCQYCFYAFDGPNYNKERCIKCNHKCNFKRILAKDLIKSV